MTLAVLPSQDVAGVVGKPYKAAAFCSVPGCNRVTEHGHHIFRRSLLKGAYYWVRVPDGRVFGNLTGLCVPHHEDVTGSQGGHRRWIQLHEDTYWWGRLREGASLHPEWERDFVPLGPLDPQPPTPDLLDVSQPTTEAESDRCPSCGQRRRRAPAIRTAGARRRKSWIVKVPDDHEDGADVLDTLVDDLAPLLGIDPTATGRYFVLVPVLVYAQQDTHAFMEAIEGIGGHRHEEP